MKQYALLVLLTGLLSTTSQGQQALTREPTLVSPQIHDNHSVTFRLKAPTATTATISGNWMRSEGFARPSATMQKGADGI